MPRYVTLFTMSDHEAGDWDPLSALTTARLMLRRFPWEAVCAIVEGRRLDDFALDYPTEGDSVIAGLLWRDGPEASHPDVSGGIGRCSSGQVASSSGGSVHGPARPRGGRSGVRHGAVTSGTRRCRPRPSTPSSLSPGRGYRQRHRGRHRSRQRRFPESLEKAGFRLVGRSDVLRYRLDLSLIDAVGGLTGQREGCVVQARRVRPGEDATIGPALRLTGWGTLDSGVTVPSRVTARIAVSLRHRRSGPFPHHMTCGGGRRGRRSRGGEREPEKRRPCVALEQPDRGTGIGTIPGLSARRRLTGRGGEKGNGPKDDIFATPFTWLLMSTTLNAGRRQGLGHHVEGRTEGPTHEEP